MKKEEKRNSIPEETNAEPLNDEALETVSGGRRLEISFDLNKKSDLQDPGRKNNGKELDHGTQRRTDCKSKRNKDAGGTGRACKGEQHRSDRGGSKGIL